MQTIIRLMAAATVGLDDALVLVLVALCFPRWRRWKLEHIRTYARLFVLLLSLAAVAGSLWLEYGAGLAPCLMCWWQRIFMYPIFILAAVATIKNTPFEEIADYVLALSVFGAAVALYQHLLQILPSGSLIPCSATDECAVRSIFEFGFVTLPWMSLSVFAALFLIALLARKAR